MDLALVVSALMLGLAGAPHCVAMCGAACAALTGQGGAAGWVFHATRLAGYAVAGGVAAGSVGALASLAAASPALRPLWTLAHAAALALGLWLAWHGRQPAWLESLGRRRGIDAPDATGWQRMRGPGRAAVAGGLWIAWPCGLLQSALVVAALANTPAAGAAAMAAFAVASGSGLALGPWLWRRFSASGGAAASLGGVWAVRFAGVLLAAASAWALGHDLLVRFVAWCVS